MTHRSHNNHFLSLVLLLTASLVSAQDITSNLVARYSFEGTGNDSIGTNHCTLMNGATYTTGKFGQGLSLDGTNDYAACTTGATLDLPQTFSIAAWVTMTANGNYPGIVMRTAEWNIPNSAWGFYTNGTNRLLGVKGGSTNVEPAGFIIPLSTITFLGVANDASGVTIYLNASSASDLGFGASANAGKTLQIGTFINGSGHFTGMIDEVCIYSGRKLTSADMTALRTSSAGCQTSTPRRRAMWFSWLGGRSMYARR